MTMQFASVPSPLRKSYAKNPTSHRVHRTLVVRSQVPHGRCAQNTDASRNWFSTLSRRMQLAVVGGAASFTLAEQAAFAHGVDASMSDLPVVLGGCAFALGMVVTGNVLAANMNHGEESKAEAKRVCYDSEDEGEGFACDIVEPEVDLYRDTLLRYLGYSNECGEAFRPLVGNFWANMTYVIAVSYVLADALDKGKKANRNTAMNRASEAFKRLDVNLQGYLTYDQVRAAFRELRVPLTLEQVKAYLKKADVLRNNRITYEEFMWSVERADTEMQMLMDAGASQSSSENVIPNTIQNLKRRSSAAATSTESAQKDLEAATTALSNPNIDESDRKKALQTLESVRSSLTTAGAELQTGQGLLEKLAATQYNWKGKPFQATIFSAIAGVDALVWQLTASVIMPGFTINRVVTLSSILLAEYGPHDGLAAQVASYGPTVIGLAVIPFIVTPLDVLADVLLDQTLRKLLFLAIDTDQNGSITLEELSDKLALRPEYLPRAQIEELFTMMDKDNDGKISIEEWSNGGFDQYKKMLKKWSRRNGAGYALGK
mmetsp:Transcript_46546/g.88870  ORF Transcript_46546/g.88870 Transcript_46546/m.88870 type:complete len:545 (-) Transcript_46546:451-2085(-)